MHFARRLFHASGSLQVNTKVQTFQLDMSTDTRITFRDKTHFDRLVWSASEQVHLTVGQVPTDALSSGSAPTITESATAESAPTEATTTEPDDYYTLSTGSSLQAAGNTRINAETDQFIVRLLPHKRTGRPHLLTELIVRLQNGFPTTEREAREFDARQEENLQKLAKEILGENVVLGRKKRDGPKVRPNDPCTCGGPKKFKKCCGAA